jgi:5-(carboxyamino)imidazole ribonucleotide synthase
MGLGIGMGLRVGVVGGGQLARMMIPPAVNLGIELHVLSEAEGSSARLAATQIGDFRDINTVVKFAEGLDVLTFDHEHVPRAVLDAVAGAGVPIRPSADALASAQNKLVMRDKLVALGLPVPRWAVATTTADVSEFLATFHNQPVIAKTPSGGYDGKGVREILGPSEVTDWLGDGPVLLEEKVMFVAEVSQLVARSPSGEMQTWPLVETRQSGGVCVEVIAPSSASEFTSNHARHIASTIAEELGVTGVLAVEMFLMESGDLLINELAMRPHNSGHIFTELSLTSQFEQHLRAVLDLPLGSTDLIAPAGVMVNIFDGVDQVGVRSALRANPSLKIHDYGKSARRGRKVGHVSLIGTEWESLLHLARIGASEITGNPVP